RRSSDLTRPRARPRGARGPWAHLSERPAGRAHPRDRGAQHRALDREQCSVLGDGGSGPAHAKARGRGVNDLTCSAMTGPSKPLGMSDFFALEAGEYLERLDGLLAKGESPSADELVRLARALRGSALMANQPAIARAAAGLEALGRAVREGRRAWDAATRHLAVRGVDDLKVF